MTRSIRIATVLALAVLGAPLTGLAPAYGHASMVASTPEQGAVLDVMPDAVSFEFSEPMDPVAYVVVTAPDGSAVAVGAPEVSGDTVTQAVRDAGAGTYLMAVKAVSEDGHPVTGRVEFAVGEPSQQAAPQSSVTVEPTKDHDDTIASPAEGGHSSALRWRGHAAWVWLVGPAFALAGAGLWLAARRAPS